MTTVPCHSGKGISKDVRDMVHVNSKAGHVQYIMLKETLVCSCSRLVVAMLDKFFESFLWENVFLQLLSRLL